MPNQSKGRSRLASRACSPVPLGAIPLAGLAAIALAVTKFGYSKLAYVEASSDEAMASWAVTVTTALPVRSRQRANSVLAMKMLE